MVFVARIRAGDVYLDCLVQLVFLTTKFFEVLSRSSLWVLVWKNLHAGRRQFRKRTLVKTDHPPVLGTSAGELPRIDLFDSICRRLVLVICPR
jgi:hypothetical protein